MGSRGKRIKILFIKLKHGLPRQLSKKGACYQPQRPKFGLQIPHGGRELTLTSCSLTSTIASAPAHTLASTHTHTGKRKEKRRVGEGGKKNCEQALFMSHEPFLGHIAP